MEEPRAIVQVTGKFLSFLIDSEAVWSVLHVSSGETHPPQVSDGVDNKAGDTLSVSQQQPRL